VSERFLNRKDTRTEVPEYNPYVPKFTIIVCVFDIVIEKLFLSILPRVQTSISSRLCACYFLCSSCFSHFGHCDLYLLPASCTSHSSCGYISSKVMLLSIQPLFVVMQRLLLRF